MHLEYLYSATCSHNACTHTAISIVDACNIPAGALTVSTASDASMNGAITVLSATDASSATDTAASTSLGGGLAVKKSAFVGTSLDVSSLLTAASTANVTGDLVLSSGTLTTLDNVTALSLTKTGVCAWFWVCVGVYVCA